MNSSIVTLILAIWAVTETITFARKGPENSFLSPASSPSSDCFNLINGMMDCISFLSGEDPAPGASCCSGLKAVTEVNAYCICYSLEMGSELGFEINMTRAEAMPDDCGIAAPPISFCNMSTAPAATPETTPPSAESPPPAQHFHPPTAAPTPSISPSPESMSLPPESFSPSPESISPSPESISLPPESISLPPESFSPSPESISTSPESPVSPSPGAATPAPSFSPIQPPAADIPAEGEEPSLPPSSDTGTPPPASDKPRLHPKFAVFLLFLCLVFTCFF